MGLFSNFRKDKDKKPDVVENAADDVGDEAPAETKAEADKSGLMNRRGFIKRSAIYTGAVLLGSAFLEACSKAGVAPSADTAPIVAGGTPVTTTSHIDTGKFGVYYGKLQDVNPITDLTGYDRVVVQPAYITAAMANAIDPKTGKATYPNLIGYGSGISLVDPFPNGATTTSQAPEYVALWKSIKAMNGFLIDPKTNQPLLDPTNGNSPRPTMVDLRIPAVTTLVHDYLVKLGTDFPKGLFLDSTDAATYTENTDYINPKYVAVSPTDSTPQDPNQPEFVPDSSQPGGYKRFTNYYGGVTQAMINLVGAVSYDIAVATGKPIGAKDPNGNDLYSTGHGTIVAGALYESVALPPNQLLKMVARTGCTVSQESQYFRAPNDPNTKGSNDYTIARLGALADQYKDVNTILNNAKAGSGRPLMNVVDLEPINSGAGTPTANYEAALQPVAKFYEANAAQFAARAGVPFQASLYVSNFDFNNPHDLHGNAAVNTSHIVKNSNTDKHEHGDKLELKNPIQEDQTLMAQNQPGYTLHKDGLETGGFIDRRTELGV